jgi:hypothetical protein
MSCPLAGTELRTLVINPGAWRPGYDSPRAKSCRNPNACVGGATLSARYDATRSHTCAPGLRGAYCELCDATAHTQCPSLSSCIEHTECH